MRRLAAVAALGAALATTPAYATAGPAPGSAASLATGHWTAGKRSPLSPRTDPVLAWDGTELLVVGGDSGSTTLSDGAAWNPRTNRWRRLSDAPRPVDDSDAAVVTGGLLFVAGHGGPEVVLSPYAGGEALAVTGRAAASEPGVWTTLPASPLGDVDDPSATARHGGHVVLAGGSPHGAMPDHGNRVVADYDVGRNSWSRLPDVPTAQPLVAAQVTDLRGTLYLQAFWQVVKTTSDGFSSRSGQEVYRLDHGRWVRSSLAGLPLAQPIPVGRDTVLDGGTNCAPYESCPPPGPGFTLVDAHGRVLEAPEPGLFYNAPGITTGKAYVIPGQVFDPSTRRWRKLPAHGLGGSPVYAWTGKVLVAYRGGRVASLSGA